ncbi:MAG: tryptophan synthase subunit alpha [Actinomycetota bacterium]
MHHLGSTLALERHLGDLLAGGRKFFVPYLTAGLPSPEGFVDLAAELSEAADTLEVGIPFSDPIMDGPVIQEATTRALGAGITVERCFELIRQAVPHLSAPVVAMTYFNPVHHLGCDLFAKALEEAGGAGVIVPDLPYEESGELAAALEVRGLAAVQMVAPTTPPERTATLSERSRGFVYAVSTLGVTGEREALDRLARVVVERIRPHTGLAVLLGIGISTGDQAHQAAEIADGVIVGSAIMKRILEDDATAALGLAREIRAALDRAFDSSTERSRGG